MLQYDFDESVGHWVCMTSHALRRALNAELSREKITLRQWEVLAWLSLRGEQSQCELAERLGVEAPTLAGILTRMERDGWLRRQACAGDRRKKLLRATPKADAVWERMAECARLVRVRAIEGLSAEELGFLKEACARIRRNLGEMAEDEAGEGEQMLLAGCPERAAAPSAAGARR